ncbi:MAG: hypothetical protein ACI90V_006575 [Bacillariaceae sp.]|jgi:hypothetical protein
MAYHLSTKAATPPGSSNIPSWSNNKESSSEDVNLFRILNEVSKMSLVPQKQQQECERPPSASASESASASASSSLPLSLSSLLSIAKQSYSCSTPDRFSIASNSNVKRTLHVPRCLFTTPPPLVVTNKIKQQRESSLPPTTSTSTTVPVGIFLGRRKRQRCCGEGPPPMLPSSPEFDNTADINPFGRHVAIHSPIAGVGNTMNLEFIAKIKLEPPPPPPPPINNCNVAARQRQQQHTRSLSSSFTTSSSASTSSSSTNISSPSLSEEKMMMIDRIQNIFPILDGDTEDGDGGNIEQERGEKNEMIIGIKTRALKMRRKCHNNNHCNIFEPTAFTI